MINLGANYQLIEKIGSGAAGVVWRGTDKRNGEAIAAKILRDEYAEDQDIVARFIQERMILTGLHGETIVETRDLVVDAGRLAIVMEFVHGQSLRQLLQQKQTLSPYDAVTIIRHVLKALINAHQQGIVHRDVKPDNVLLKDSWERGKLGTIKLTDFGISRIITEGARTSTFLVGTPEYLAPETIERAEAAFPADAYGVGIMLYELLAGRTPFAGAPSDYTVAHRHITAAVPELDINKALWSIVTKLLEKRSHVRMDVEQAQRELANIHRGLRDEQALERQQDPQDYEAVRGSMTVLRPNGITPQSEPEEDTKTASKSWDIPSPALGEAPSRTVLRQQAFRETHSLEPEIPGEVIEGKAVKRKALLKRLGIILGALVFSGLVIWGGYVAFSSKPKTPAEPITVTQESVDSPAGLTTSREATYDPTTNEVTLHIHYGARGVALTGPFFEVVGFDGTCPDIEWNLPNQEHNISARTFISHECGWSLNPGEVKPGASVDIIGTFEVEDGITDQAQLQDWLDGNVDQTDSLLLDVETNSTSYPAQRLQGVKVEVPNRVRSGQPITVTVLPIWPHGVDALNPIYVSPHHGELTSVFKQIASNESNMRFSDGCAGAVSVSRDGLLVTALRPASRCEVILQLGEFDNVTSNSFDVIGHES